MARSRALCAGLLDWERTSDGGGKAGGGGEVGGGGAAWGVAGAAFDLAGNLTAQVHEVGGRSDALCAAARTLRRALQPTRAAMLASSALLLVAALWMRACWYRYQTLNQVGHLTTHGRRDLRPASLTI